MNENVGEKGEEKRSGIVRTYVPPPSHLPTLLSLSLDKQSNFLFWGGGGVDIIYILQFVVSIVRNIPLMACMGCVVGGGRRCVTHHLIMVHGSFFVVRHPRREAPRGEYILI